MNARAVLFVLGNLLAIFGLAMLAPLLVAVIYVSKGDTETIEVVAFGAVASGAVGLGVVVRHFFRHASGGVHVREGFAIVALSWLLMAMVGMLPYLVIGATDSVTDAFFETMSGFTTTGASVFRDFRAIPPALMFWRCMTQWLGGMGIVVLSVALLPMLGVGGYRLLKAETPGGVAYERERPRITDAAKELWKLYLLISATLVMALVISGMSFYDAICHAFTTMSTGGFSPRPESVGFYKNPFTQWLIILFMFIAGANFALHARLLRGEPLVMFKNAEFRAYAVTILAAIGILIVSLYDGELSEKLVRDVCFQTLSIATTTGFATADFNLWPGLARLCLFFLMFVGGCMGSTAGGMKIARFIIYQKAVVRELHRLIFPHAVRPIRIGDKVIEPEVVANIFAFALFFAACFTLGALVMAACGYDLVTSLTASVAAIGNIGPGLGRVGPVENWSHLPQVAKWVMSFLMLCGRLELFSVLVLFTPWVWRR